jgi:hypothetical protein
LRLWKKVGFGNSTQAALAEGVIHPQITSVMMGRTFFSIRFTSLFVVSPASHRTASTVDHGKREERVGRPTSRCAPSPKGGGSSNELKMLFRPKAGKRRTLRFEALQLAHLVQLAQLVKSQFNVLTKSGLGLMRRA